MVTGKTGSSRTCTAAAICSRKGGKNVGVGRPRSVEERRGFEVKSEGPFQPSDRMQRWEIVPLIGAGQSSGVAREAGVESCKKNSAVFWEDR